ncbi:MAG: hypothetical protein IPL53_19495 [Ignavibacteria bacterium]|nr:hypothetical protein [Ignavibacteria bacterium]
MVRDTARVVLRYQTSPYTIADSAKAVLDSNGNGVFTFTRIGNRVPYFITVKNRNTIETWSKNPVEFENNLKDFDFTYSAAQAFGNNQIHLGTKYCLYNGDVNQDGNIDLTDIVAVSNNLAAFTMGYKVTDIDGNNITDLTDLLQTYNNSSNFVRSKKH